MYSSHLSFKSHIAGFIRRHTTEFSSAFCLVGPHRALSKNNESDDGSMIWNLSLQIEKTLIGLVRSRFLSYTGILPKLIILSVINYSSDVRLLKLCPLENRRDMTDQLHFSNLPHGKVDSSLLLERISLWVLNMHTRYREPFLLPTSRSNFSVNDLLNLCVL